MRCAKCAALRFSDLERGEVCLHDSLEELIASAERGCDFCTLCWTHCKQYRYDRYIKFKNGLGDTSVWLGGVVYLNRMHSARIDQNDHPLPPSCINIHFGGFLQKGTAEINQKRMSVGELSLFADPDTPAASLLTERWTTADRNPSGHLSFVRRCMEFCRHNHKLCARPSSNIQMPTRLVDLGDPCDEKVVVRLVHTQESDVKAPYLALSYCWGSAKSCSVMLLPDNIEELQSHIDEEELPGVYRDAFRFARDLNFRYIWIDALCIIQGHHPDWEYESPRMSLVYGNAALTIVAGRVADCKEEFLQNNFRSATGPCAIPFDDGRGEPNNIWVALSRSTEEGPVSKRGWCFQEGVLSYRALVFGKEQLRFQCQELRVWEDGHIERTPLYRMKNARDPVYASVYTAQKSLAPVGQASDTWEQRDMELRRRMLIYWYKEILWNYTIRKTTISKDVFAAVSGLAQRAQVQIRSRYLAGLWEADMVRGLLWKPAHVYLRGSHYVAKCQRRMVKSQGDIGQMVPMKVPSWSWASIEGQVGVAYLNRDELQYQSSNVLIRPKYEDRWTRDSACHVRMVDIPSCELQLFGRPRRVRAHREYPELPQWAKAHKDPGYAECYLGRSILVPVEETETGRPLVDSYDPVKLENMVARGYFDVGAERVDICWCMPLTKKEGLLLTRDENGKYRRAGTIRITDLAWMMAVEEEEICLI